MNPFHTCCGQRVRVRVVDGKPVVQPHECANKSDTAGLDWAKIKEAQSCE